MQKIGEHDEMDSFDRILAVEIRIATLRYNLGTLENAEKTLMRGIKENLTSIDRECLRAIRAQNEKIRAELEELCNSMAIIPPSEIVSTTSNGNDLLFNPDLVVERVSTRSQMNSESSRQARENFLATLTPQQIVQSCQQIFGRPERKNPTGLRSLFKHRK